MHAQNPLKNEIDDVDKIFSSTAPPKKLWIYETEKNREHGKFDEFEINRSIFPIENWINSLDLSPATKQLLPMIPYSYKKVETSIRGDIKRAIKMKKPQLGLVTFYYKVKCLSTFGLRNSKIANTPGSNITLTIPGGCVLGLNTPFSEFGFYDLDCTTQEEEKWFIDAWGEPQDHKSMHSVYGEIWRRYELLYKENMEKENESSGMNLLNRLHAAKMAGDQIEQLKILNEIRNHNC